MNFEHIKSAVKSKMEEWLQTETVLFMTEVSKEDVWNTYIDNFDQQYKQEHTCNCCKSFLRQYGNVVAIRNGKKETLWELMSLIKL